jgi:small conductance mechanosensitive channel
MDAATIYNKIVNWLLFAGPRILVAVVVFFVGQWFIRLMHKWTHRGLQKKRFAPSLRPFLLNLVFTSMQVLLAIALMQILGIQMSIFAALVASVGVAVGLALSGTLQNFTSGILILVLKPYRVGDNIVAQGHEGTVSSIQLFYTIITTYDNRSVIVPNSKLSNELIVNVTQQGCRRMDTQLELPFTIPYPQVKELVEKTVSGYGKVLDKPPMRIGVGDLKKDSYIVFINLWIPAHGFQDETLVFREALLASLTGAGFKLPDL